MVNRAPVVTTMVIGKGPDERMGRKADENDVGGHQEGQRCGTVHEVDVHRLAACPTLPLDAGEPGCSPLLALPTIPLCVVKSARAVGTG